VWCDWGHHGSGGGGAPDPVFDAFFWTSALILAASIAILILAGPFLIPRTRRIRDLFWKVPLINLPFYLVSILFRPYPGGFAARFQSPGLGYMIAEIIILLIASSIVALIFAIVLRIMRIIKSRSTGQEQD